MYSVICGRGATFNGRIPQEQVVSTLNIESSDSSYIRPCNVRSGMIAMKESWHEARFFAFINQRFDDINTDGWRQHSQQNELVAVVIPQRRIGIITEAFVDNFATFIGEIAVGIASERGPREKSGKNRNKRVRAGAQCRPSP